MSFRLDPAFDALFAELGWRARSTRSQDELVIGDYAHGFLVLERDRDIQIARREVRGAPSLKMWTASPEWAQHYLAYWTARLVRYRRGLPDRRAITAIDDLNPAFRLDLSDPSGVFLLATGSSEAWAGFGRGNEYAAVAFSNYARVTVQQTIDAVLGE